MDSATLTPEKITTDLLPQKFGKRGMIWVGILVSICLIGAYAYYRQLTKGLIVTNMRDYVSWGITFQTLFFLWQLVLSGPLSLPFFD